MTFNSTLKETLQKGHWSDWNYALSLTLGKYLTTTITEFNRIRTLVKLVFDSPLVPLGHFNVQSFKIRLHEFNPFYLTRVSKWMIVAHILNNPTFH